MMSTTLSGGIIIIEIRFAAIKYITVGSYNNSYNNKLHGAWLYYIGDVPDNGVETFSI